MGSKFYLRLALVFITISMFSFITVAQTTINIKVIDALDDVEEYRDAGTSSPVGYMDHGSSDLELTSEAAVRRQMVGIIFRAVAIPKGSSITSAFIQFTCDDDDNQEGPLPVDIWGIKEANTSAPFTDALFNVTSRPSTTAKVTWNIPVWATKEARTANERTIDIKTLVQEIVNQAGWVSGNNMGFKFTNEEMGNIHREAEAKDEGAGGEPELIVSFAAGTGINPIDAASSGSIYPNPARGQVTITNPSAGRFDYSIYSITGKLVASRHNITGPTTEVNLSGFLQGVYLVDVRTAEKAKTQKLIIY